MNDDYMRELNLAAKAWADSFDQGRAGVAAADLVLRNLRHEEPTVELQLRELVTSELTYVLRVDASARTGGDPVTRDQQCGARPDAGEELRHAAARLDQLTSISELSSGGVDRGWPTDAAAALHLASRVSELLVELLAYTTGPVLDNLDRGVVVALPAAGADDIPNQPAVVAHHRRKAATIAGLLGEVAAKLEKPSGHIAHLQHTTNALPGAGRHDGPTLDAEVVLEWRMLGMANESRFHVRVFRPPGERPVVVMGDMDDNRSQSITNTVEEVAAVVAAELFDGAAHDSFRWVVVYPPGKFRGPGSESGVIKAVRFEEPYGRPRWRDCTHDDLVQLVSGAVRIWHSSEYTVPVMTQRDVPILHPETKRYRPCPNSLGSPASSTSTASPPAQAAIGQLPPKKGPWWRCWRGR
ncbi:hypothetical protein E1218_31490 [Kribbella turkmenica]|uniref:Uncharacterized protein n=1 Tax=Kribbella turkmenica TaxID=2530375 RepID=A0A4R4WGP3_9ACTN|nr:hypothetical protein [Kribbella turkmenica]TDD15424.1 hypothetical protein E1218_31490 [Kribbella turkmenica]